MVLRRPEHAGTGQLHGAVAQPPHRVAAKAEGAGLVMLDMMGLLGGRRTDGDALPEIIRSNSHGLFGIANSEMELDDLAAFVAVARPGDFAMGPGSVAAAPPA